MKALQPDRFSLIIGALIFTILLILPSVIISTCPKGVTNDSFPGRCGLYIDQDQNQVCDLSEVTAAAIQLPAKKFNFSYSLQSGAFILLLFISTGLLFFKTKSPYRYLILGAGLIVGFFTFKSVCPIGFLQYLLILKDKAVLNLFLFLLFLLPILLAVLFGRVFCGWVCPIGALQEFFFRIPRWLKVNWPDLTKKIPSWANYFPLLVLAVIGFWVVKSGQTIFCQLDPFGYLFGFSTSLVLLGGLLFLLLVSVFIFRPFCLFLCPLGAIFFALSGTSIWRIKRNKKKCRQCKICVQKCPTGAINRNLKIDQKACIRCQECLFSCPERALSYKA